jgi:uncharacterized membrane protein
VGGVSHSRFRLILIVAAAVLAVVVFLALPGLAKTAPGSPAIPLRERLIAAFFLPLAAAAVPFIIGRVAAKEPFRANYDRFRATYELLLDLAVVLIVAVQFLLQGWLLVFHRLSHARLWFIPTTLVGLTLIIAGNVLPRLRPNSALGIRTPWTLRDERAWSRTHRAAGYLLVFLGLAFLAITLIDFQKVWWVTLTGLVLVLAGLPLLSFFYWRQERSRTAP